MLTKMIESLGKNNLFIAFARKTINLACVLVNYKLFLKPKKSNRLFIYSFLLSN